jgi:pimeloyl-ACP methyl ester carboxylesterase
VPISFGTGDGLVLRGERWGDPAPGAPSLTFVHGAGLAVSGYREAFSGIADRAAVYALNARGHGGADVPSEFAGYGLPVADLRAFAESLPKPVILAGHSFGALLSMRLAAEVPGLAAGLLLMEPLLPWRRGGGWKAAGEGPDGPLIEATRGRREVWPSREEAAAWLRARSVYRGWTERCFAGYLETALRDDPGAAPEQRVRLACPPWLEAAVYLHRPGEEVFDWAKAARLPAVVVRGSASSHCIADGAEDLARAYGLGTVLTVEGDHTFPMEHPEETGRVLRAALEILARGLEANAYGERAERAEDGSAE